MGYAELIAMLEKLPPERQAEVFDFAEFIAARANLKWGRYHLWGS